MKERALPFSAPLVPRVLDGSKTQTRRVMKGQPFISSPEFDSNDGAAEFYRADECIARVKCQYGKVGDRLYVKEDYYQYGHWKPVEGVKTKGGKQKWKFVPYSESIKFEAPSLFRSSMDRDDPAMPYWHKRLGRFMPRKYSRITLEITDIRVERLNEISEADAKAEGIERIVDNSPLCGPDCWRDYSADGLIPFDGDKPIASFRSLWESINGTGSWQENPWVWVIKFRRLEK